MKKVETKLLTTLKEGATVVCACSGGPDSMALLSVINNIREKLNLKVICAHVNHKVRKESDDEAKLVEKYAIDNNDIFELFEITKYHEKTNFHEDARIIRYKFLEDVVNKYNADYLMTAHHGDDLIETILMRISRGSNLKGYIGFKYINNWNKIKLIRPLVFKTKEELENYNKEKNIPYVIDNSNYSELYTRNRYRHNILPLLKYEDKNIHLKYLKFSMELNKYYEYVYNDAMNIYREIVDENKNIIVSKLIKEKRLIVELIIQKLIIDIQSFDYLPINDNLFDEMIDIVFNSKTNISIDLPNDYEFGKEYDILYLKKKKNNVETLDFELTSDYIGKGFNIKFTDKYEKSNFQIALNSSELCLPLRIRNKNNNDTMEVLNLNGHKKVNQIFIDAKINPKIRNEYPVLVDNGGNVLWIPGVKKSKFAKSNNEKYDIILKYEEN